MRRNRRKLAAQLLDQQLSQAVDETLTKANIHPPPLPKRRLPPAIAAPRSILATAPPLAGEPSHSPAYLSTTCPELPMPHFTNFDLSALPHILPSTSTPPPVQTPIPFRTLPRWCPKIPSLTLGDVWRDCLPTFFDLSALPEIADGQSEVQKSVAKVEVCRDMQVWRPIGVGFGREQSRFFPSRNRQSAEEDEAGVDGRARVKLPPPLGCRLHASDSDAISLETLPGSTAAQYQHGPNHTMPLPPALERKQVSRASSEVESTQDVIDETVAANLWRILSATPPTRSSPVNSDCRSSPIDATHYHAAQCHLDDNDCLPPYELEGQEIAVPYVHANSLTGYSNESESIMPPWRYEEPRYAADSGIGLPIVRLSEQYDPSMNELVVNHDLSDHTAFELAAAVSLPPSLPATPPATPPTQSVSDIAAILPVECVVENEYRHSDAHFQSEQALFLQSPPLKGEAMLKTHNTLDHSSINVADFLKLGHAKQCWCGRCIDEPYFITAEEAEDSNQASKALTEDGGGDRKGDEGSFLSLVINPSESEPDCNLETLDLPSPVDPLMAPARLESKGSEATEDDDWFFFSSATTQDCPPSPSAAYLPSSPILHRQRSRAPTPTIIITSTDTSSQDNSDEYVAVASPTVASPASSGTRSSWLDRVPRRPSSAWEAGLTTYGDEGIGCGFAKALESSWRWGMEDDDEWWDWAVEDEC